MWRYQGEEVRKRGDSSNAGMRGCGDAGMWASGSAGIHRYSDVETSQDARPFNPISHVLGPSVDILRFATPLLSVQFEL